MQASSSASAASAEQQPHAQPPRKLKAWMSWSTGKDCSFALHEAMQSGLYEITGLLTTITETFDRVSMHGVRSEILRAQAAAIGVPLITVLIPFPCPNGTYEQRMGEVMARAKAEGVEAVLFGDLFLEDIRAYREEKLAPTGIKPVFPLWKRLPSDQMARKIIGAGIRAVVICLDPKKVPTELAGHEFNEELLAKLPAGVDACAENGEFHTCVIGHPMFKHAPKRGANGCGELDVVIGETVTRDGFVFTDVKLREGEVRSQ